jgi:homoserine O-acetyltransferase
MAQIPSEPAAPEAWVQKRSFEVRDFRTQSGALLPLVRVGYETYGKLSAARDNAILVCHYFSGSSHCAGRYGPEDAAPGYWDAIIGPGKAIDTTRFFVLSVDTLCNVNARDPMVITTGPASIDPRTGRPYGSAFPIVTIADFVRLQKALVDALDIERLHCVAGPSMGAMQALEWGALYPERVDRLLPVFGAGLQAQAYFIALIDLWAEPILADPSWRGGDYFGASEPLEGLHRSLQAITVTARSPAWARSLFGRDWADAGADPLANAGHRYRVESTLAQIIAERGRFAEAAHVVQLVRGCRIFDVDADGGSIAAIRAPTLLISGRSDTVMFPEYSAQAALRLQAQGTAARHLSLDADGGHLDCLYEIGRMAGPIGDFLQ